MTPDLDRCEREIADAMASTAPDGWGQLLGACDWYSEAETLRTLKAPFPWFGGKSRVAHIVWDRFGNVPNYVEPFAGSLAVLLGRPHAPKTETVNDLDGHLVNFWRSIKLSPDITASWADWPVSEIDLLARHRWLVRQEFRERLRDDPDWHDARIAGWWVWGLCAWIGSGWCRQRGDGDQPDRLPHLGSAGRGERIAGYFRELSERLRDVRICSGEWDRCLGESVTVKHGITGVFLDPPYSSDEHGVTYSADSDPSAQVREWAIENGPNRMLQIALCGYEGEHEMPQDWECVAWKARGGYGSQGDGRGRENAARERIWFSPACLKPPTLFGGDA